MSTATYTTTLSGSDVNKIWRKVQGPLRQGLNFMVEEYDELKEAKDYTVDWSAREVTGPVDIYRGAGVASITEGGWEAVPSSPNVEEITLSLIMLNKRITLSKLAKYMDRNSPGSEIVKQLKFQGDKAVQSLQATVGDGFYGFSTAVLCTTTTAATQSSGAYTLTNGYGLTSITNAGYIARMFVVGDRVALVRTGALVTNAIGTVTAVSASTPSVTVTWNGSVTSQSGDQVVKANSLENTTLTGGTDYNKGAVGLLDMCTSTSVHGLSSSSVPDWSVAYSDTSGGRLTGMKIHRAKQEVMNYGDAGASGWVVRLSQGVERDLISQMQAGLRFQDPFALEIDGGIKSKGVQFKSSRRVPPTWAFIHAGNAIQKKTLLPAPTTGPVWDDLKEMIDQSGYIGTIDFPYAQICTNRKLLSYFSGLSES